MNKTLKRNVTILLSVVLTFALMASAGALTLNLSHFMSNMHPLHVNILQPFADEVKEKTEGRVEIVIHGGNSLVAATDAIDAAEAGIVDISFILPAYTPGRFLLSMIEEFPFMFDTSYQANMAAAAIKDTLQEYDYTTLKLLWFGSTDVGQIFSKMELDSAADLVGKKLRSPGTFYNDVVKGLGATEVSLPVSDLYDALDRSIVDGTFMAISALKSFKLGEVVSHVYMCNMYVTPLVMVMNWDSWDKLSEEDQAIMEELLAEFPAAIGELYDEEVQPAIDFATEKGVIFSDFTDEEMAEFHAIVEPIVANWLSVMDEKGLPGTETYETLVEAAAMYK